MSEDEHEKIKRQGSRSLREKKSRTIDIIEQDQINAHPLGKDDLDEELEDAVHDVASDETFTEEHVGKIAPTAKAGSSEIDQSARNENFSREIEVITDRKSVLRDTLKQKTDKPSDDSEKAE
jgi:hypothetical protein